MRDVAKENKTNAMKISRKYKSILSKIRKLLTDLYAFKLISDKIGSL